MEKVKRLFERRGMLYFLMALMCFMLAFLSKEYDYDLFARLIVGENFFKTGAISYYDMLSYTPTHLWFDHEWGASLIFYFFFKYLGHFGLALIQATTMFFTSFWIVKTQQLQKHKYPSTMVFMGVFILMLNHLSPSIVRCHMFSFMFFSFFLYVLEKTRIKNSNLIWLLPPLVLIWNNIHGGVVSGIGLIAMYLCGAILTKKNWKKYFYALLLSVAVLAINPYGIDYLRFLVSANLKKRTFITEWMNAFAIRHVYYYYPMFCFGFFMFLAISFFGSKKKFININLTKYIVFIVTLYLGALHVKLFPLLLITLASLFYNDIARFFGSDVIRFSEKFTRVLVVLAFIFYLPKYHYTSIKPTFIKFPIKEVEFIKINDIKGNVLCEFGAGSYVSYKIYPHNLIYMDGRYEEVYYDREFENLRYFEEGKIPVEKFINIYPTDILIINKNAPVYDILKTGKDFSEVYDGLKNSVFVKTSEKKKSYLLPVEDEKYYIKEFFKRMPQE